MEDFYHAAKLNNAAIAHLMRGKRREAFDLFKQAFAAMSHAVDDRSISVVASGGASVFRYNYVAYSSLPFVPVAIPSEELSDEDLPNYDGSSPQHHQDTYTFQKYFLFNRSLIYEHECENSYRAAILFNLSLIHQTSCTAAPPQTHSNIKQHQTVLTLLDSCLSLLRRDGLEGFYVAIAALNNKLQILHKLRDPQTTKLVDDLRLTLRDSPHHVVFDDYDMNGLLLNITCQGTRRACADAA